MKLSKERIEQIKKFCLTHPKVEAARIFRLSKNTIDNHTKGINWKKRTA